MVTTAATTPRGRFFPTPENSPPDNLNGRTPVEDGPAVDNAPPSGYHFQQDAREVCFCFSSASRTNGTRAGHSLSQLEVGHCAPLGVRHRVGPDFVESHSTNQGIGACK